MNLLRHLFSRALPDRTMPARILIKNDERGYTLVGALSLTTVAVLLAILLTGMLDGIIDSTDRVHERRETRVVYWQECPLGGDEHRLFLVASSEGVGDGQKRTQPLGPNPPRTPLNTDHIARWRADLEFPVDEARFGADLNHNGIIGDQIGTDSNHWAQGLTIDYLKPTQNNPLTWNPKTYNGDLGIHIQLVAQQDGSAPNMPDGSPYEIWANDSLACWTARSGAQIAIADSG